MFAPQIYEVAERERGAILEEIYRFTPHQLAGRVVWELMQDEVPASTFFHKARCYLHSPRMAHYLANNPALEEASGTYALGFERCPGELVGQADLIIAFNVYHQTHNPQAFWNACRTGLKRGGSLLFSEDLTAEELRQLRQLLRAHKLALLWSYPGLLIRTGWGKGTAQNLFIRHLGSD